ncbi:hypothetical protein PSJM300_00665 [Stutzerimonas stutzeri DSM 10701]|nr:hypothetical protein PSJM300_00665 [Stutzerimonas stutzeri DSM 10701]
MRSERSTIDIQAILGEQIAHGSGFIKMVPGFRDTKALASALQQRGRDQRTHRSRLVFHDALHGIEFKKSAHPTREFDIGMISNVTHSSFFI